MCRHGTNQFSTLITLKKFLNLMKKRFSLVASFKLWLSPSFGPQIFGKYPNTLRFLFYDYESVGKGWENNYCSFSPTYPMFLSSYVPFLFSHALGADMYITNKINPIYVIGFIYFLLLVTRFPGSLFL